MAKCEEGYLCDVCGGDVEEITDSDLYLRFVIGLLDPETLHTTPRAAHPLQSGAGAVHRRRRFRAGRRSKASSTSGGSTRPTSASAKRWSRAAIGGCAKSWAPICRSSTTRCRKSAPATSARPCDGVWNLWPPPRFPLGIAREHVDGVSATDQTRKRKRSTDDADFRRLICRSSALSVDNRPLPVPFALQTLIFQRRARVLRRVPGPAGYDSRALEGGRESFSPQSRAVSRALRARKSPDPFGVAWSRHTIHATSETAGVRKGSKFLEFRTCGARRGPQD